MPDVRFSPLARGLVYSLFLACSATSATLAAEERWYQVELMVFAHKPGDHSEHFTATPTLTYPGASRFLIDPQRVKANALAHPGESHLNEFGRQLIKSGELDSGTPTDQANTAPGGTASDTEIPVEGSASSAAFETSEDLAEQTPPEPIGFVLLPDSRRELRGKAAYMQRSGRYRILFHESWLQPVRSEANALPIVLDHSGNTDEPWPELQGSIKLHLARYLHLETNLWLNTDGAYLGNSQWHMPTPPRGPQSLVVEEPLENLLTEEGLGLAASNTVVEPERLNPLRDATADPNEPAVDVDPYPYRHAVLLQQKRRMRSEEIHYIDHPLVGVVVRLLPVDIEERLAQ